MQMRLCRPRPEPERPPLPSYDIEKLPRESNFGFDEKSPKYRCLCGILHVVTGTKVWAFLGFLCTIALLIFDSLDLYVDVRYPATFSPILDRMINRLESHSYAFLGFQVEYLVSILCAILAIRSAEQTMLWPFLINSAIIFGYFLRQSFVSFFLLINVVHHYEAQKRLMLFERHWILFVEEIILLAAVFVSFWQMRTVFYCKRYFTDKNSANAFLCAVTNFVQQLTQVNEEGDSPPPYESNSAPAYCGKKKILE